MEITQMLTLSTAHITKETANRLTYECRPMLPKEYTESMSFNGGLSIFEKDEFGWFIWTGGAYLNKLPEDLAQCIKLAQSVGCDWLCLDSDGLIEESLKTYEWEE